MVLKIVSFMIQIQHHRALLYPCFDWNQFVRFNINAAFFWNHYGSNIRVLLFEICGKRLKRSLVSASCITKRSSRPCFIPRTRWSKWRRKWFPQRSGLEIICNCRTPSESGLRRLPLENPFPSRKLQDKGGPRFGFGRVRMSPTSTTRLLWASEKSSR